MSIKIKSLPTKSPSKGITPNQPALIPLAEKEVDGIGMGVLSDGTPYLNQRGLASICGVQNRHIGDISREWQEPDQKPRIASIKSTLMAAGGIVPEGAHIGIVHAGIEHYCYPADVCLAVMEYYAFDAGVNCRPEARSNFRKLAGSKLRDLIYNQTGYTPTDSVVWQQFHDRVSLVYDNVPRGHFSVFREMANIIVTLIRNGAAVGSQFVPDISVGIHWSKHWSDCDLEAQFGVRRTYLHDYPESFAQSASNPQKPHCYPDPALPEFRRWMHEEYLPSKFPVYLRKQVKDGKLTGSFADAAIRALAPPTSE